MPKVKSRLLITTALVLALAGAVTAGASSGATGGSRPTSDIGDRAARTAAVLSGDAGSPGTAVFRGTHSPGRVRSGHGGRCLTRSTTAGPASLCATTDEIASGQSVEVTDECGASGEDGMRIFGLVPEDTATVRVLESDGSHHDVAVESGAFLFEGQNPGTGDPYPTGVRWLAADGSQVGEGEWPVHGDQFCIEPTGAPSAP